MNEVKELEIIELGDVSKNTKENPPDRFLDGGQQFPFLWFDGQ